MPYINISISNIATILIAIIIILIIYAIIFKKLSKKISKTQHIINVIFIVYCVFLFVLTLFSNPISRENVTKINLMPFVSIIQAFTYRIYFTMMQFVVNIIMFIPAGVLILQINKRINSFAKGILIIVLLSLAIEILQLWFPLSNRIFDVNDIICNTLGGLIGLLVFTIYQQIKKKKRIIFVVANSAILIIIVLLITIPFFTPNKYNVNFIDSGFFLPNKLIYDNIIVYNKNPELLEAYSMEDIDINSIKYVSYNISEKEALSNALNGVVISIYTEGMPHPDSIEIDKAVLGYIPNNDNTKMIPVWECRGKAFKESKENNAVIIVPATWF